MNDEDYWQQQTDRPLTPEDYRQIRENLVGFFSLLQQWSESDKDN